MILCVLTYHSDAVLLNIKCDYKIMNWEIFSSYSCDVQDKINVVLTEGLTINSSIGTHLSGMNNSFVTSFFSHDKNFQFFPKDLDKVFHNLKAVAIGLSHLEEIHKDDLKPFTKLIYLSLHFNDIEVIEENLFEFNPNLKVISLNNNKIKEIHSKVFDNLPSLVTLRLKENNCIGQISQLNSTFVSNVIKHVKLQCTVSEQIIIEKEIKALEKSINNFKLGDNENNSTESDENFTKIEAQINDLGLPKSHKLSKMLDEINVVKIPLVTSLFKEIYNSNQELSEQVTAIQEDLESFKAEATLVLQKILEKLDEKSKKIDKETIDKITELQNAQNQKIADLNGRLESLENALNSF